MGTKPVLRRNQNIALRLRRKDGSLHKQGKRNCANITCPLDTLLLTFLVKETDRILKLLQKEQLPEQEVLISWLKKAKEYTGFYILGL